MISCSPDCSPQSVIWMHQGESPAFTLTFVQSFLTVNNFIVCCNIRLSLEPAAHEELLCPLRKYKEVVQSEHCVARRRVSADRWIVTMQSAGMGVYPHHGHTMLHFRQIVCFQLWLLKALRVGESDFFAVVARVHSLPLRGHCWSKT